VHPRESIKAFCPPFPRAGFWQWPLRVGLAAFFLAVFPGRSAADTYNYIEVLQKSMWFYEVQRSGVLPDDNRVEWRGSSAVDDGKDVGHDLSGGWYDAGDNMKFNFPMASAVTLLAWGGLENSAAYWNSGQWGWLLANIKWATDYFIRCHTAPDEFYGQIGVGMTDHKWWGAPEVIPFERPAFKIDATHPGSELAGETAAALAAASMLFRTSDPAYADLCIRHARELFTFADTRRGLYHEAITDVTDFYKSWSGYQDELVWAAVWLYIATGEAPYLAKAEEWYGELEKEPQSTTPKYKEALSWDEKTFGCYVLLAKITNKEKYHTDTQRWLDWWSYGYAARGSGKTSWESDAGISYTPSGLAWVRQWGPLRYAANTAFAAFVYSDCHSLPAARKKLYYDWAKSQIDYALGSNERGRSYVCGFGVNPPVSPHHRSMHGPYLDDNGRTPVKSRHVLYGALVGGPDQTGAFTDDRLDAVRNEVAVDYNAGFSSAVARLAGDFGGTPVAGFPAPAQRDTEYRVVAKINTVGDRFTEISATVQNMTTWPARYSEDLTIRYYFDLSEVFTAGYTVDDVFAEYRVCHLCSSDTLPFRGPLPVSGKPNLFYVEIGFEGETIYPGGQSAYRREVQFRIGLPETAPQTLWDPSNDPSFAGLSTTADTAGHPGIPAFEKGKLVWGKDIDGTVFAPSTAPAHDFSAPSFALSGWNNAIFKGIDPDGTRFSAVPATPRHPFSLGRCNGAFTLTAHERLTARLVQLDGRVVVRKELGRNAVLRLPPPSLSTPGVLLMRVTCRSGKTETVPLYRY
jgi:endoglucanase